VLGFENRKGLAKLLVVKLFVCVKDLAHAIRKIFYTDRKRKRTKKSEMILYSLVCESLCSILLRALFEELVC